jgi:putative addiction module component (TIGR02574 family)
MVVCPWLALSVQCTDEGEQLMSQAFSDVELHRLTFPERIELITRLWDSLPEDMEGIPIPDWHREELERRLAAADANPDAAIPWEEARRRLRERS